MGFPRSSRSFCWEIPCFFTISIVDVKWGDSSKSRHPPATLATEVPHLCLAPVRQPPRSGGRLDFQVVHIFSWGLEPGVFFVFF